MNVHLYNGIRMTDRAIRRDKLNYICEGKKLQLIRKKNRRAIEPTKRDSKREDKFRIGKTISFKRNGAQLAERQSE